MGRESVLDARVFSVLRERKVRPGKSEPTHDFYVLDCVDWFNVIPVTPAEELVLIAHYRHGTDEVRLEIPGGMIDPEDESPARAALRELREETGYGAPSRLVELGCVHPNPAIQNNRCFTYLAEGVTAEGPARPDDTEDIRVELHPLADAEKLIREGLISHALVVAAFYWLEHRGTG